MRSLVLASLALSSVAAAQEAGLVLDEQCYWRRYCQFGMNRLSPAVLKAGGARFLQGRIAERVKRDTEKSLQARGIDPAKVDWRDRAVLGMGGGGFRSNDPVPTSPPPDDWMQPDFDDSAWVRERRPFQGGPAPGITNIGLGQYDESVDLRLLAACYRTRFVLPEPEALTLQLAYSGGARVFVNGREIARGHLPKVVVLTRCDVATKEQVADAERQLRRWCGERPVVLSEHRPVALLAHGTQDTRPLDWLVGRRVLGFSALGNPEALPGTLRALGAEVVGHEVFRDHHWYSEADLAGIARRAAEAGTEAVVTTEKDAVKIGEFPAGGPPLCVLAIELAVTRGEDLLVAALERVASA